MNVVLLRKLHGGEYSESGLSFITLLNRGLAISNVKNVNGFW
ncbi:hypothetical protein LF1_48820 [Rubripirellula obstinata]|uniref:Uncharacterized protein n=1 Tax=Rubripirellula obstinata TaxID=406547 RepID=A0A5B1CMT0_9BACT|nr:hypothetical protein LF1_48820 [Rubripirellula obstinata]